MEVSASEEEYTIFTVPIKLNGKECYLDCSIDNKTREGSILGVKSSIENGVSAKDYKKLEVGDKITTLFGTGSIENNTLDLVDIDTIKVKEDTNFSLTDLGDATYALLFEMQTADGKDYTSEAAFFQVKNNTMKFIE